jgi:hypothetical protein
MLTGQERTLKKWPENSKNANHSNRSNSEHDLKSKLADNGKREDYISDHISDDSAHNVSDKVSDKISESASDRNIPRSSSGGSGEGGVTFWGASGAPPKPKSDRNLPQMDSHLSLERMIGTALVLASLEVKQTLNPKTRNPKTRNPKP